MEFMFMFMFTIHNNMQNSFFLKIISKLHIVLNVHVSMYQR